MPLASAPSPFDLVRLSDLGEAVADSAAAPATQRLITAVSRMILTTLNRPAILPRRYVEMREVGASGVMLANWPVTAVESVSRGATSTFGVDGSGWTLEPADDAPPGRPQMLMCGAFGGRFGPPVTIAYTAGYQVAAEPSTVPSSAPYQAASAQPYGDWASDGGVTYANGTPLLKTTSSPGPGQYAVDTIGNYTFSAADAGASILLTYGYVPADLANAALDWIKDRIAYGERIGMRSKSLGGQETVSYAITDTPSFVKAALQSYMAVVPLC